MSDCTRPGSRAGSSLDPRPIADLGVLFVHGIGHHEAGATLRSMGGALADYVDERLAARPDLSVELMAPQTSPASTLSLSFRPAEGSEVIWRLQEARWDASFPEPEIGEVSRWSLLVAPWILHREAFRWWARRGGPQLRKILRFGRDGLNYVLRFVGFTLGAIALQALVLVSLAFVWIRPVRLALDALLARTVGDAHRFINDPDSLSTMAGLVSRELHGLSGSCRRVMIVAHSQGAAVARAAIELAGPPANLVRLVTLGAGITKLHALQELRRRQTFLAYWLIIRLLLVVFFVATFRSLQYSIHFQVTTSVLLVALFAPMRGVVRSERRTRARIGQTPGLGTRWSWLDLWSTRDLVPDGPLWVAHDEGASPVTSLRVDNAGSWISDHVTYLSNSGQVLPLIYGVAIGSSGIRDPGLAQDLERLWGHRTRRAFIRGRGFLLAPFAGGLVVLLCAALLNSGGSAAGAVSLAGMVIAPLAWSRLWRRWESACRRWEPRGCTVPAGWRDLIQPAFWMRLSPVAPGPDPRGTGREVTIHQIALALEGSRGLPGPEPRVHGSRRSGPISRTLILLAAAAFVGTLGLAAPALWGVVGVLRGSLEGVSGTALIAGVLLEPPVVALALASIVLPGIFLDAMAELGTESSRSGLRLSGAALACSLAVAGIGVASGLILTLTVRPIHTLAVDDCLDRHPLDPLSAPEDQLHFDAIRIPCREPHEAQVISVLPLEGDDLPSPFDPARLGAEACQEVSTTGPIRLSRTSSGARSVRVAAYVPLTSATLEEWGGGVYCLVEAAGCQRALVGRVDGRVHLEARPGAWSGCATGDGKATSGDEEPRQAHEATRASYLHVVLVDA